MSISIYPTISGVRGMDKFPSRELVYDTTRLIRFANIRSSRAIICANINVRVLRGIISVENHAIKYWVEWQWEAVYYPISLPYKSTSYSCDAVILKRPSWQEVFTRGCLEDIAWRLQEKRRLAVIERIALFMDGCLAAFTTKNIAVIGKDITFVPPVE